MGICRGWRSPLFFSVLPLVLFLPLILSVSKLHRSTPIPQVSKRSRPSKSDHLVLGTAQPPPMPRAVKKIHSSSSQQNLQTRDGISFVTVYTIYNSSIGSDSSRIHDGSSELVTVANSSDSIAERSVAILNVFIDVIQVSMPRSSIIVLTDPASDFTINRSNTTILPIPGDYSRGNLMLQRISSYIAFLEGRLQEHSKGLRIYSHYIFAVSDITVVDDLGNIFHKYPDFHLALTFRNNKYQPLKSGFVAVRGTADGIYRAKIFLEEVLNVYSLKFMKASRMLGDQLALAWVVKSHLPFAPRKFSMHEAFSGEINGVSILFYHVLFIIGPHQRALGSFMACPWMCRLFTSKAQGSD